MENENYTFQMYQKNEKAFEHDVNRFMIRNNRRIHRLPVWQNMPITLFQLFLAVYERGGFHEVRTVSTLRWHHNGHNRVSNHQPHDCLLNRSFRRTSKKTSKLRVTGLCAGNSPETGEFPAQMASNAENVSIWWRPYDRKLTPWGRVTHIRVSKLTIIQIISCRLNGAKQLSEPMQEYC